MKKLSLVLLTLIIFSCNKDEDFDEKKIIGKWELVIITDNDGTINPNTASHCEEKQFYTFTEDTLKAEIVQNRDICEFGIVYSEYVEEDGIITFTYTLEGYNDEIIDKVNILELNSETLRFKVIYSSERGGEIDLETYTFKKFS